VVALRVLGPLEHPEMVGGPHECTLPLGFPFHIVFFGEHCDEGMAGTGGLVGHVGKDRGDGLAR